MERQMGKPSDSGEAEDGGAWVGASSIWRTVHTGRPGRSGGKQGGLSQLQADPCHTLGLLRPQFPEVTEEKLVVCQAQSWLPWVEEEEEEVWVPATALGSSHISVFPLLPRQDLCEVGP